MSNNLEQENEQKKIKYRLNSINLNSVEIEFILLDSNQDQEIEVQFDNEEPETLPKPYILKREKLEYQKKYKIEANIKGEKSTESKIEFELSTVNSFFEALMVQISRISITYYYFPVIENWETSSTERFNTLSNQYEDKAYEKLKGPIVGNLFQIFNPNNRVSSFNFSSGDSQTNSLPEVNKHFYILKNSSTQISQLMKSPFSDPIESELWAQFQDSFDFLSKLFLPFIRSKKEFFYCFDHYLKILDDWKHKKLEKKKIIVQISPKFTSKIETILNIIKKAKKELKKVQNNFEKDKSTLSLTDYYFPFHMNHDTIPYIKHKIDLLHKIYRTYSVDTFLEQINSVQAELNDLIESTTKLQTQLDDLEQQKDLLQKFIDENFEKFTIPENTEIKKFGTSQLFSTKDSDYFKAQIPTEAWIPLFYLKHFCFTHSYQFVRSDSSNEIISQNPKPLRRMSKLKKKSEQLLRNFLLLFSYFHSYNIFFAKDNEFDPEFLPLSKNGKIPSFFLFNDLDFSFFRKNIDAETKKERVNSDIEKILDLMENNTEIKDSDDFEQSLLFLLSSLFKFPSYWDNKEKKENEKDQTFEIDVSEKDEIYILIKDLFEKSGLKVSKLKIQRQENVKLYSNYLSFQESVLLNGVTSLKITQNNVNSKANEVFLFYGDELDNFANSFYNLDYLSEEINKKYHGFSFFADPKDAHDFASNDPNDLFSQHVLYYSRVCAGDTQEFSSKLPKCYHLQKDSYYIKSQNSDLPIQVLFAFDQNQFYHEYKIIYSLN